MNRQTLFNYIEERLATLSIRINRNGKLNQLDLNSHSEYFYEHFFNKLYGWELHNKNQEKRNVEAIDLVDDANKFVVQVSAVCTKQKIESSLAKDIIKEHSGYRFKFIAISRDAADLRGKTFNNPHGIAFNPESDIYDATSILEEVRSKEISILEDIFQFIKKELGVKVDITKLDSNLTKIVNILAKEDLTSGNDITINEFEIERKLTFNNLDAAKLIVNDYSAHSPRLDKIYAVFDSQGKNVSNAVLAKIRNEYTRNKNKSNSADDLFFLITDNIKTYILGSSNQDHMPMEELELCVNIVVVDAFIRCKIFENPKGYNYANS